MSCACTAVGKYRCRCGESYCSVACFKKHKLVCEEVKRGPTDFVQDKSSVEIKDIVDSVAVESVEPVSVASSALQAQAEVQSQAQAHPDVASLLSYKALQIHLKDILALLNDESLSGESTMEGRRAVAMKKITQLRVGGLEQNELFEEFCQKVLEI